jgi:ribonuclease HI
MAHKDGKTYITVSTDAGFKDGIVTFGIWISCDKGRYKYAGIANEKYNDSTEAELIALCNGIEQLQKNHQDVLSYCDILIFNTDSTNAIRAIQTPKHGHRFNKFTSYFNDIKAELQSKHKFKLQLRHVKGHSNDKKGARYFVNNWCDKQARKLREHGRKANND